jgi:putative FmdB family regulatory protein
MPTYDYRCEECGNEFEALHGVHESVDKCPRCGGGVRRLFRPVGIIFKGSGFYKTDSRSAPDNGDSKSSPEKTEKELDTQEGKGNGKKEKAAKKTAAVD